MRIPPYWAKARYEGEDHKGRQKAFVGCGWSFSSPQEAWNEASARAKRIFDLITRGKKPARYEYHDRPIREEIVEEVRDNGSPIAIVTRNRYGALILNCSNALFVDVDFPSPRPTGLLDALLMAISRKKREAKRQALAMATIHQVEQWAGLNPAHGFRLYCTKGGLRLLFTGNLYEPTSTETASILSGLHSDPLYVTLTLKQECFRARLTSKPWRCGCTRPPTSFPWENAEDENAFRQWEADYTRRDAEFKVCDLIAEFGPPAAIDSLRMIVDIHDRGSRIEADAPLA
jgi:hypothetical protein